ncbi:MAG: hypothetical protein IT560_00275 [Alphaproteobacteria bacterium]|nr:hypothetical protein [Alphaproteobacteria bacterium]
MTIEDMVGAIKIAQKVESHRKAALSQKALPDMILEEMVSTLPGDKKEFLKRSKRFRDVHGSELLFARHLAEKGLLKKHGYLEDTKKHNKKILSEVTSIIKTSKDLQRMYGGIHLTSEMADGQHPTLMMHLEAYINETDTEKRGKDLIDFLSLLKQHILVFSQIQGTLKILQKHRNPNTVELLSSFLEVIARMYGAITGKKFTVSEYGDEEYYSDGMIFAKAAMQLLRTPAFDSHSRYAHFLSQQQYTEGNFHSACRRASDALKSTGKKKGK